MVTERANAIDTMESVFHIHRNLGTWCLYIGAMALIAFLVFGSAINLPVNRVAADEKNAFSDMEMLNKNISTLFSPDRGLPIRPPRDILMLLGYKLWGTSAVGFHGQLVFFHVFASILLAYVLIKMGFDWELGFLAGLLFLLNVAHFRAVHWIICLNYVLSFIFTLCSLAAFHRFLKTDSKYWHLLALTSIILAVFSHPSSAAMLLFFPYMAWRCGYATGQAVRQALPAMLTTIFSGYLAFVVSPHMGQIQGAIADPQFERLWKNPLWYTGRLFSSAYWLPESALANGPAWWELAIGGAVFIAIPLCYIRKAHTMMDGLVWMAISAMPFINHPAGRLTIGPSRQLYLSSAGYCLCLAFSLRWMVMRGLPRVSPNIRRLLFSSAIATLVVFGFVSLKRAEAVTLYILSRSYIASGELQSGAQHLQEALHRSPEIVPFDAYLRLATACFASGEPRTEIFEEGLKHHPDHPQLRLLRGISLLLSNQPELVQKGRQDILEAFQKAEDKSSLRTDAGLAFQNLAGFYHEHKQYEKAIAYYREALAYRPNYAIARFNLANALYKLNRAEEAIETMQQAVEIDPENRNAVQFLGNMLFEQKRFEEAEIVYNQYLLLDSKNPNVYHNLAIAHQRQGNATKAIQAFKQGIAVAPADLDMRAKLAVALREVGNHEGAIREYESILEQDPTNKQALEQITALYIAARRPQEAARWIQKALELDSTRAHIWYLLAHTRQAANDIQGLRQSLGNAVKRDPSNADYRNAYLNLGGVFQQQGKVQIARNIYTELLTYAPDLQAAHINLGILNYSQGNYPAAVENFSTAVALAPGDVEALLGLAQAQAKNGQLLDEAQTYQQILMHDPNNAIAQNRLHEIKK